MNPTINLYDKRRALEVMLKINPSGAPLEVLMPLVEDKDGEVRWLVAELLVHRHDAVALPLVLKHLQSAKNEFEKLRGLNLLDRIGHASAAPIIIRFLTDGHRRVRRTAALTLATLGPEAVDCLKNYWDKFSVEEKRDVKKAFENIPQVNV